MKFFLLFIFIYNTPALGQINPKVQNLKTTVLSKKKKSHSPKIKTKDACKKKGVEILPSKKYSLSIQKSLFGGNILNKNMEIPIKKKLEPSSKNCPAHCKQTNNIKTFVKIEPQSILINSCPYKEAQENYKFEKSFKYTGTKKIIPKKSMLKASQQMNDWILNTFVNPWLPIKKGTPSKEYLKILKDACPSCSFYLSYDYSFIKDDQVDINMNVQCGDRRKLLSVDQNAVMIVKNYWKCNLNN